ncbi:NAD(P)/FAD-dependent oxidoreductase [Mycobacterium haemophilum]|uniref:Dehydrogenase n=1 Tax=Mycobacterium haemophilum TaxID=29311 RepID=A0A0I9UR68_9MYCO|nr:FAD/NAD(P)-binding oxidoreductase [Mycobacterium haemophilum]KLO33420.1 dehydrogenase [Mycobacterium haemophilum]KLO38944.1 dehydrogenase [Mycobacterium haemophilum]KLO45361.1 dehydrogenase [Mycobacterium haemophilum]KLO56511.1 dehydrogenase [Mycobacterium haemophilum]
MSKTVLVLGAGVGGLTTADTLRQLLPPEDRIILVDKGFDGTLGLSLLWVLRGWRRPDEVHVRATSASLPGVELVTATVDRIDISGQAVHTDHGVIGYDALVIALGASLNAAAVPGLTDALDAGVAGQFYTLDGAAELHAKVEALQHGRIAVLIAGVPFKCPAAPFEAAFLMAAQLGDRFADGTVRIDTFTPDPLPMPVAGPEVGEALVAMLKDRGIGFHPRKTISRVDSAETTLRFDDGTSEPFDLLAVVPPHVPSAAARSTGLGGVGWIPVDPHTLSATVDNAWAIGDAAVLPLANGKPLPKAAVFAEAQARVVAHGVAHHLGYDAPERLFTGEGACYVETGDGQAAKGAGNFLSSPAPSVRLYPPSREFHEEKVAQERAWLDRWNT